MDSVIQALTVERVYAHPRETVFRAWTEASRLEKWFSPNPKNRVVAKLDLRIGGTYRIAMIPPQGDGWVVGGIYREIDNPSRLSFTWKWEDSTEEASLVGVDFQETDVGTRVLVTHTELESPESVENHREGWIGILSRLADYCDDIMEWQAHTPLDVLSAGLQVEFAKKLAQMGFSRLQRSLEFVPEDKREWAPSPTSKSAQRIAAHCAVANRQFAAILRGDQAPYRTARELASEVYEEETSLVEWNETLATLEAANTEALAAFEHVDPKRVMSDAKVAFVLSLMGRHADGHAGQLEYLQTVWGDTVDHF